MRKRLDRNYYTTFTCDLCTFLNGGRISTLCTFCNHDRISGLCTFLNLCNCDRIAWTVECLTAEREVKGSIPRARPTLKVLNN